MHFVIKEHRRVFEARDFGRGGLEPQTGQSGDSLFRCEVIDGMKPTGDQSCVSAFPIPIARTVLTFSWAEEEEQIACWDSPQAKKEEQSAHAEGMLSLLDSSDSCPSTVARIPAGETCGEEDRVVQRLSG